MARINESRDYIDSNGWYAHKQNKMWYLGEVNDLTREDVLELIDILETIRDNY